MQTLAACGRWSAAGPVNTINDGGGDRAAPVMGLSNAGEVEVVAAGAYERHRLLKRHPDQLRRHLL